MLWLIIGNFIAVFAALIPFAKNAHWSIRFFDFPRVQFLTFGLVLIVINILFFNTSIVGLISFLALIFVTAYQLKKVMRYTKLRKVEVKKIKGETDMPSVKIMVSNVLTPNRSAQKLIDHVQRHQPDILLCVETDAWWEEQLSVLEESYPTQVKIPQDNLYGMHLYSKLDFKSTEIRFLVEDEIPSIRTQFVLPSGDEILFYALHPKPPSPTENETSINRDAELLIVAKEIDQMTEPVIVCGDLNDVAWSKSTELFKKISALLDSRIGRGRFSTFHAKYSFLRWPLDHFFHSSHFMLRDMQVLSSIDSDHFPIMIQLYYSSRAKKIHNPPEADVEDEKEAHQKIDKAF
ncbi:MAG: endonuclease/exonuclease/phosphatase family protein [Psychroflexus sp.]|nr:endonuclease/exonuclease/phosphatase family protein [Psychroflexus sp.]